MDRIYLIVHNSLLINNSPSVQEYHRAFRSFSGNSLIREPKPGEMVADSKGHTELLIKEGNQVQLLPLNQLQR